MSVQFVKQGSRLTKAAAPADTNAATLYTVGADMLGAVLSGMNISGTSTSGSATVWWNDGSTDYLLLDAKAISANTTELYTFGNPFIKPGGSIKVKTSNANHLTFVLTVEQMTGRGTQ